jgi:CheY-like chemotaxis protein
MTNTLPMGLPASNLGLLPASRHSETKPLILVIGRNDDTRSMLRTILELWNYEVAETYSTEESLALSRARRPSLVLLETTPHFTASLDDLSKLRQSDGLRETPTVMLSGYSRQSYLEAALEIGASAVLTTPVDFDLLRDHIEKLVAASTSH